MIAPKLRPNSNPITDDVGRGWCGGRGYEVVAVVIVMGCGRGRGSRGKACLVSTGGTGTWHGANH